MKYSKIILPTIFISSSLLVLYDIKNQKSQLSTKTANSTNQESSSLYQTDETSNNIVYQKLSILSNRCRGCGKCVRLDPSHFEMSGEIATVITSTNLNSSNLSLAIANCPSQAITLE